MKAGVLCLINDAHPPTPELLDDAVVRDGLADEWRRLRRLRRHVSLDEQRVERDLRKGTGHADAEHLHLPGAYVPRDPEE